MTASIRPWRFRESPSRKPTATGWALDLTDAMVIGRRIGNLMRVYNHRCGITKDLEAPSVRYRSSPVDGPVKGVSTKEIWDKAVRRYYELMGCNPDTRYPLPFTFKEP